MEKIYQNKLKKVTKTQQLLIALLVFIIACGFCAIGFGAMSVARAEVVTELVEMPSSYSVASNVKLWAVDRGVDRITMDNIVVRMASYDFMPRQFSSGDEIIYRYENSAPEANYYWEGRYRNIKPHSPEADSIGMAGDLIIFTGIGVPDAVDSTNVKIMKKVVVDKSNIAERVSLTNTNGIVKFGSLDDGVCTSNTSDDYLCLTYFCKQNVTAQLATNANYENYINIGHAQMVKDFNAKTKKSNFPKTNYQANINTAIIEQSVWDLKAGDVITVFFKFQKKITEQNTVTQYSSNFTYVVPELVSLPANPTKVGHTFAGWYFDAELQQPYDNSPIIADTTLYAKFTINSYTVTYWVNGDIDSTSTVVYNNKATAKTITAVGKSFSGWYKDIACTQAYNFDTDLITDDTSLYSKLDVIRVSVTFMVGETLYQKITVDYGTSFVDMASATACCDTLQAFKIGCVGATTFEPISSDTIITSDSVVSAELYDGLGGWLNMGLWLIKNWIWLLVGVSCAIVAVVIFVVVYKKS